MHKILVLVDRIKPSKKKLTRFLNRNSDKKYKAYLHQFSELIFEIKTKKVVIKVGKTDLSHFDLVFVRRAGKYVRFMGAITKYLDKRKVEFVDPAYRTIGMSMDKASSAICLALKRVPIPESVFVFRQTILDNADLIIKDLGFPIIAKGILSQRNKNIYILRQKQDFVRLVKRCKMEFIFQKYIDIKSEYRFLIMGEKIMVLEQKFKRNYENLKVEYQDLTGPSIFLKLDETCVKSNCIALKSAKVLGLDIAGVDLAIEKKTNKNYVIEVNKGPGIIPDARTSPELKAFSDYLKQKIPHFKRDNLM